MKEFFILSFIDVLIYDISHVFICIFQESVLILLQEIKLIVLNFKIIEVLKQNIFINFFSELKRDFKYIIKIVSLNEIIFIIKFREGFQVKLKSFFNQKFIYIVVIFICLN